MLKVEIVVKNEADAITDHSKEQSKLDLPFANTNDDDRHKYQNTPQKKEMWCNEVKTIRIGIMQCTEY